MHTAYRLTDQQTGEAVPYTSLYTALQWAASHDDRTYVLAEQNALGLWPVLTITGERVALADDEAMAIIKEWRL